jgi:hypothetical protein
MKMNSKLLFYKEGEERSQYVHTGRKMSTLPGRKAQFERMPKSLISVGRPHLRLTLYIRVKQVII